MPRLIVSSGFVWSDYPGLRVGRMYAGKPDLTRHPQGEIHLVDDADAVETRCGLPRTPFPHEFPDATPLDRRSAPCPTCRPAGLAATDRHHPGAPIP